MINSNKKQKYVGFFSVFKTKVYYVIRFNLEKKFNFTIVFRNMNTSG